MLGNNLKRYYGTFLIKLKQKAGREGALHFCNSVGEYIQVGGKKREIA